MKKIILLATLSVAGLISAKNSESKELTSEQKESSFSKAVYYPVKITSSCGYTEYIETGGSNFDCIEVEIDRMEDECDAPVIGWGYA